MVRILVLPRQAVVEACEAVPADTPLDLIKAFPFPDQDAQRLAVQRERGLQLTDGEGGGEGCLAHGSRGWNANQARLTARRREAPVWGQSNLNHAAAHTLQHGLQPVVHIEGLQQPLGVGMRGFVTHH